MAPFFTREWYLPKNEKEVLSGDAAFVWRANTCRNASSARKYSQVARIGLRRNDLRRSIKANILTGNIRLLVAA